jgi:hypothetical protein
VPPPPPVATPAVPAQPEPAPVAATVSIPFPGAPVQPPIVAAPVARAPVAVAPVVLVGITGSTPRYHAPAPRIGSARPPVRLVPWPTLHVEHVIRTVVIVRTRVVRAARASSHHLLSAPLLPLPPVPPARAPLSFGAAAVEGAAHGSASVGAIATGADGLGFFGLFVGVSLLAPLVRGTFARARPHPPG